MAKFLAAKFPDTLHMRDKRGGLPCDLVSNWTHQWEHVLGTRDPETNTAVPTT